MTSQKEQVKGENSQETGWKKMKLVSISFKEASLDTPSFRASVNYYQTRIEIFQEWIEKVIDYMDNKYAASVDDFQRAHNTFISLLLPSPVILSNGFVANQLNTPSLVESFNMTYNDLCTRIFKMICEKDFGCPNALLELMNTAIEPYQNKRANFEYYQNKYDNIVGKYQAIKISNTTLDPSAIREDAFHVFEIRKEYLKASLELICAISTMKLAIDKFLLEVMRSIQSRTCYSVKESGKNIDLAPLITANVNDYAHWIENAIESSKILAPDMQHAKQQVMDYSLSKIAPSREINDYNVRSISFSSLLNKITDPVSNSPEKSGWLYMKTTVGTPTRVVWVRRWCFLKNSVFGLFLLSSSKTCVEETDKFGILLTSIRYDPDEDRKFCFEVKIMNQRYPETRTNNRDIRLVFQTESLKELKSWLNAFESSKRYASNLDHDSIGYDMAFKRYSPEFLEFASSSTTTTDQLITTCAENTISIMNIPDSELANLYMDSSTGHKFFQFQLAITPISTKYTQMAVIANLYKRGQQHPNAVLANIWGSANWSDYAIYDKEQEVIFQTSTKRQKPSNSVAIKNYPDFYPTSMKVNDIQFKSLFFTVNQKLNQFPEELLLFNFSAFWCPNKRQRFSANCYATVNHLYCYMNSMGFICLTQRNLADLVSVEIDSSTDNLLRIYDVNGIQQKIFVYFVDLQLIAAKLQYLLENKALMRPKKEEDVLKNLNRIDTEFHEKQKRDALNSSRVSNERAESADSFSTTLCRSFWPQGEEIVNLSNRRISIQRDYSLMYRHAYEVSSKCLLHILYGNQSIAFPRSLFLAAKDNNTNISGNWIEVKKEDGQSELVRTLEFNLDVTDSFLSNSQRGKASKLNLKQRMVRLIENKYYEIEQDPVIIKTPFCRPFRARVKHLIMESHESQTLIEPAPSSCLLYLFYKFEFIDASTGHVVNDYTMIERTVLGWAKYFTSIEYVSIRRIIRYYLEKFGKHGKTLKAIKVCGLIGIAENRSESEKSSIKPGTSEPISSEEPINIDVSYSSSIIFKVILKMIGYRITNMAFVFIRFIFQWLLMMISNVTQINRALLLGLLISVTLNLYLSGRASLAYWSVKGAETAFQDFIQENNENLIEHTISISDLDLLSLNLAYEQDNIPYKKFNESHSAEIYKYKASRNEIASKRNDLLIELKILQNMEREVVQGQYRQFLKSELEKCHIVQKEVFQVWENDTHLQGYCDNCREELYRLSSLLL